MGRHQQFVSSASSERLSPEVHGYGDGQVCEYAPQRFSWPSLGPDSIDRRRGRWLDAKAVGQWARGLRSPHPDAERRLRDAYQVVGLLLEYDAPETVRAWFGGMNPHLDDQAPATG